MINRGDGVGFQTEFHTLGHAGSIPAPATPPDARPSLGVSSPRAVNPSGRGAFCLRGLE